MRSLVVSEQENIAAIMEDGKAIDFYISRNSYGVGDVYTVSVENIMPSIDAVFVKLEEGRMGFLHANDVPGHGDLYNRVYPGQKLLVQIVKEPTGNKGPRVNLAISLPGRYYVLTTEHKNITISRRITENPERDRLKSITNLMKPEEMGMVIRTEALGRSQAELEEDFVNLWEIWSQINDKHEHNNYPGLVYKEQDFLYGCLRDFFNNTVDEICVAGMPAKYRTEEFLKTWTNREIEVKYFEADTLLYKTGVEKELKNCLRNRVDLPSGGYIIIQTTEALTAIDINSGKFTSSSTLKETVRRTNMEAAVEIARHMRLRNIGGMIIVDFIDMSDREDRIKVLETLESALRNDKAKPQVGQLTDLCLVEITRKRSGQALSEVFGLECPHCEGLGFTFKLGDKSHSHQSSASSTQQNRHPQQNHPKSQTNNRFQQRNQSHHPRPPMKNRPSGPRPNFSGNRPPQNRFQNNDQSRDREQNRDRDQSRDRDTHVERKTFDQTHMTKEERLPYKEPEKKLPVPIKKDTLDTTQTNIQDGTEQERILMARKNRTSKTIHRLKHRHYNQAKSQQERTPENEGQTNSTEN
jgi:ribonuclease E